ncbi:phage tail protein [Photorhabdus heterorhabditis]|uniref:phage tail protein n=1 Tax=Photorhabdus heterorhabditis TaxID=880156 RepID=UPI001C26747C|nr:phage tail protein [Photorhabdus heterorhabditis]
MFGLDNPSGVSVMPPITPASNPNPLWFTEGGAGLSVSYPGQEWFNIVQAELLSVLQAANVRPDKSKLDQLAVAIKSIVAEKSIVLTDKLGNSSVLAASQKLVSEVNDNANNKLAKSQNGADIPDKNAFVKNLGLVETVNKANNAVPSSRKINGKVLSGDVSLNAGDVGAYTQTESDNNFARGNVEVVNTMSAYPRINFFPVAGKKSRGYFAIEASLNDDNYQSIYVYHRNSADENIYIVNFPQKSGTLATLDDINVPVGIPLPYPHRYTPAGYLTCNGQTFDKSLYPKLAEAYPSGRVPDLRGEFIRGWDDSRGVDPGRVCGTWQGDAIRNITGSVETDRAQISNATGAFGGPAAVAGANINGSTLQIGRDFTFDASRVVPTANENRPRNIAFNYIVRAA